MDAIERQLEFLNDTMKDTASEANAFLLKYHFGGLIAVLALLNVDLVVLKPGQISTTLDFGLVTLAVAGVIFLSWKYFSLVLSHYQRFSQSHRKLKYKFELTLHALLTGGAAPDYQYFLEQSVAADPGDVPDALALPGPEGYSFQDFAAYLLNHHRRRYREIDGKDAPYLRIAMLIILITLGVRLTFLAVASLN